MKKENKNVKLAALASGAVMIGAFGTNANAAELLNFEDLGSGSELRSNLITADAMSAFTSNTDVEFECGEGKCGEGKCGEGKCGEGKCGEKGKKEEKKDDNKASMKSSEKSSEKSSDNSMQMKPTTQEQEKAATKTEKPKN